MPRPSNAIPYDLVSQAWYNVNGANQDNVFLSNLEAIRDFATYIYALGYEAGEKDTDLANKIHEAFRGRAPGYRAEDM